MLLPVGIIFNIIKFDIKYTSSHIQRIFCCIKIYLNYFNIPYNYEYCKLFLSTKPEEFFINKIAMRIIN